MNEQQVIALINAQIKANDNKEITGNILNLVLKEMVAQPNLLIGDLSSLSTGINDDLVSAINWLLTQISGGNIVIHTGQNNPNETPPATYTVGDLYSQLDVMNNPLYLWQYTGTEWARISNYIDDSIEALDTTWSSYKISEAIKGDRLNSNGTVVLDGNEITISDLSWWIQGNPYILIPPFSDTIPYTSAPGLSRKDIVVAIQANSLIRIPGDEGTGIVQPPQVPPNTLLVTEFDVYHDSVGETTEPITGDQYIKKSSEAFVQIVPTTAEIKLNIDNNRNFVVNAPDEVTIVGVVKTDTNGSTSTDTNWSGSDLHIYRKIGSNNVKIKHHDIPNWTAKGYTLYFPDEEDYDMEEGEILTFKIMQPGTLITNSPIMAFPIYIFAGSSKKGGVDGDFIPLSGTEVGKPLTGEIEADTSNGFVGFYSEQGGIERRIAMTDDGLNTISTIDADNNKAEIVVGDYGTVRFNSVMPNDESEGYMYYNSSEGLNIGRDNSSDYISLDAGFIGGFSNNPWYLVKENTDTTYSYLLLPDSGPTERRIPVSVNGNYADASGNIVVSTGAAQDLQSVLNEGNTAVNTSFYINDTSNESAVQIAGDMISIDTDYGEYVFITPYTIHMGISTGRNIISTGTPTQQNTHTLQNKSGVIAHLDDIVSGGSTSDDISNESTVIGTNVTEALDELQTQITDIDGLPTPTANEFLVGNSAGTEWEKRGVLPSDLGIVSNNRVPYMISGNVWASTQISINPSSSSFPMRNSSGVLRGSNAIESNDLVPLGQLNTVLEDYIQEPTTDGTSGQVLTTDGSGGRSWTTPTGGITALIGDVVASGTGSVASTIANGVVTNAKLANVAGYSIKGKATTGTGVVGDITLGTNTILGRGSGSIVPLTLDSSLQISGSTLRVNPANDRYTKTYFVDLTITMGQFLALHTTPVPFPSLGLAGGEYAFIESAAGVVDLNFTGGTLNSNPGDNVRLAIYREPTRIVGGSTYGEQNMGAKKFVNQFHVGNFTNEPATSFQLGTEAPVTYSGTPTGTVKVRVYYKISNF